MRHFKLSFFLILAWGVSCRTASAPAAHPEQFDPCNFSEESRTRAERGEFHAAMQLLPADLRKWDECVANTGSSHEGARSFLKFHVIDLVSTKGDAEWGAILDDANIPYGNKTEMVFEILEARLGKGSVYLANEETIVIPRKHRIDLDKEMIKLPEK